jgi:hypothetical protein
MTAINFRLPRGRRLQFDLSREYNLKILKYRGQGSRADNKCVGRKKITVSLYFDSVKYVFNSLYTKNWTIIRTTGQ